MARRCLSALLESQSVRDCFTDGSVMHMQVVSDAYAGVTLNSDASTRLGQGGKKTQVFQNCDAGICLAIHVFMCVQMYILMFSV